MKFKKSELDEIIDGDGELIGSDAVPKSGSNLETQASKTTDYNANVSHQPFKYDMLGRFGFSYFFENEDTYDKSNEVLDELAKFMYDKYMEILEYYYRNPQKLKSDFRKKSKLDFETDDSTSIDYESAEKILDIIKPHMEDSLKSLDEKLRESIDENEFLEGKLLDKSDIRELKSERDNGESEIFDKKIKKIAGLIDKMSDKNKNKILKLLEDK